MFFFLCYLYNYILRFCLKMVQIYRNFVTDDDDFELKFL